MANNDNVMARVSVGRSILVECRACCAGAPGYNSHMIQLIKYTRPSSMVVERSSSEYHLGYCKKRT